MFTSAFCGKVFAMFDRFDHHPKKALLTRLCQVSSKFQREKILRTSEPQTRSVYGITIRSLKLADSWHFETHCSHFCVTNPTKLSKRRAQTDNLKSINLPQVFLRGIPTSLLQCTPSFTTRSLPFAMRLFR